MPKKSITESRIVGFIESMECLPVAKIPEGLEWTYEILCGPPPHNNSWTKPLRGIDLARPFYRLTHGMLGRE
jgi:hypothetical protein